MWVTLFISAILLGTGVSAGPANVSDTPALLADPTSSPPTLGDPTPSPAPADPNTTITDTPQVTTGPDFRRTVILFEKETNPEEDVFFQGGIDYSHRDGCIRGTAAEKNPCSIPIRHLDLNISESTEAREAWAKGDNFLDWEGPEGHQGIFGGSAASGTAGQWTSNDPSGEYYFPLNTYGAHYWTVDVMMDCSRTENGFFEVKALVNQQWESGASLSGNCTGSGAAQPPYDSTNHLGRCGYVNVFHYGVETCEIVAFPAVPVVG